MEIFRAAGLSRLPGGSRLRCLRKNNIIKGDVIVQEVHPLANQIKDCKIRAENVVHSPMENWPLTLISKLNFKFEKIINLK